jgi:TonB family protein
MRAVHAIVSSAAVAAALLACPAGAAPEREPWARVGDWQLAPFPGGACFVTRKYASGTYLHLTRSNGGRIQLSVGNSKFSLFVFGSYRMSLIVGGKRRPLSLGSNGSSINAGLSLSADAGLIAQLRAATALELDGPDGTLLERLDLGGLAPALERLPECVAKGAAMPYSGPTPSPPTPPPSARAPLPLATGKQRPPRPRIALSHVMGDYPPAALRAGEEGMTEFRIQVDIKGRVTGCTVTRSSGSATLDSETCRMLVVRARFEPALDSEGRPTPAETRGRIVWRLPQPPAPPREAR